MHPSSDHDLLISIATDVRSIKDRLGEFCTKEHCQTVQEKFEPARKFVIWFKYTILTAVLAAGLSLVVMEYNGSPAGLSGRSVGAPTALPGLAGN